MVIVPNSERLSYQLMTVDDADLLWQLDQDPEVMHFISGGQLTSRDDIEQRLIPRMCAYRNPAQGWGIWKTSDIHTGEYYGWTLVRPMNFFNERRDDSDIELGWRYHRHSWGKGFATEAARTIAIALSRQTSVTKFSAMAIEDNTGSIAIMRKLGMSFVKKDIESDGPNGPQEAVYYSVDVADIGLH